MLPRKSPLTICWPTPASGPGLLQDLELAVLDHLHRRLVAPVPVLEERELAERRGQVLHLGEPGLDVRPAALAPGLLDGLGDREDAGVGLRAELVGVHAARLHDLEE